MDTHSLLVGILDAINAVIIIIIENQYFDPNNTPYQNPYIQ